MKSSILLFQALVATFVRADDVLHIFDTAPPGTQWVNAEGQIVLPHKYDWGHYAVKELDTAMPRHCGRNGTLVGLERRQDTCSDGYVMTCPPTDAYPCCPVASPQCCPAPATVCCPTGKFCQGVTTCCNTGTIGCGEACCTAGSTCCGASCCASGSTCTAGVCSAVQTTPPPSNPTTPANPQTTSHSTTSTGGLNIPSDIPKPKPKPNPAVIGGAIGGTLGGLSIIGAGALLWIKKRKKKTPPSDMYSPTMPYQQQPPPSAMPTPYPTTPSVYSPPPSAAPLMTENPYAGYVTPAPPEHGYAQQPIPHTHQYTPPSVSTWVEKPVTGGNVGWGGGGVGGVGGGAGSPAAY